MIPDRRADSLLSGSHSWTEVTQSRDTSVKQLYQIDLNMYSFYWANRKKRKETVLPFDNQKGLRWREMGEKAAPDAFHLILTRSWQFYRNPFRFRGDTIYMLALKIKICNLSWMLMQILHWLSKGKRCHKKRKTLTKNSWNTDWIWHFYWDNMFIFYFLPNSGTCFLVEESSMKESSLRTLVKGRQSDKLSGDFDAANKPRKTFFSVEE
jgi:hypothetical protein